MSSDRLYDRNFVCAFVSQIGFVLANTALMAHYARWVAYLGGEVDEAGWIMGTASIAALILRPWMGQWIDRYGAKLVWQAGYTLFVLGALSNLWLEGLGPEIYVCRSLLVVGAAIVFSSSLTYVTHLAPPHRRTEAIGILGVAGFIGIVLGPLVGDLLLSESRTRDEFESMFLTAAGLMAVPIVLLAFLRKVDQTNAAGGVATAQASTNRGLTGLREFFGTTRDYWPGMIVLVQCAFGLCMTIPFVFLTKYVDDTGLLDDVVSWTSVYFMCYAGWGLTLRVMLRRFPERFGRRKVLLLGSCVMGTGMISFLLVDAAHPAWIIVPALLCGSGHSLMYHTCTSLFLHSFPTSARGAGSALSLIAMDLGIIAGSQILGEVAHQYGYNALFVIVGICTYLAAGIYAVASIPVWQGRRRESRGLTPGGSETRLPRSPQGKEQPVMEKHG